MDPLASEEPIDITLVDPPTTVLWGTETVRLLGGDTTVEHRWVLTLILQQHRRVRGRCSG